MTGFWVLWGFDALIALVVLYFFMLGITDGTVSGRNFALWLLMLLIPMAIVGGSLWLKSMDRMALARTLLWLLAIPGLMYVLFILFAVIAKPRWN